jgi:death on curing protein
MQEYDFLSVEDVLDIHIDQLQRYGGLSGIRDQCLLESAIAMPQATFDGNYVHSDLFEMAAAYLFHLGRNHPFLDGNKRTATVSALVFLRLNDYDLNTDNEILTSTVLDVIAGKISKAELAQFFRNNSCLSE